MNETEVTSVLTRADTISYATLAEMNNFQRDRVVDFKTMMQNYLREQIDFYKNVRVVFFYISQDLCRMFFPYP